MPQAMFQELARLLDRAAPELTARMAEAEDHLAAFLALSQGLPAACRAEQLWRVKQLVETEQWARLARWIFFSERVHGHSTLRIQTGFPARSAEKPWVPPRSADRMFSPQYGTSAPAFGAHLPQDGGFSFADR